MSNSGEAIPAWRRATAVEPRWHAALVVLAIVVLEILLPPELSGRGGATGPLIEITLLLAVLLVDPQRFRWMRVVTLLLIVSCTIANLISVTLLVQHIFAGVSGADARLLMINGANIWLTNVLIFALWYWDLDRGGPAGRARGTAERPDFLFPQMALTGDLAEPEWEPRVIDYLFLAMTNATAFSPTDTVPLSRWAKAAMVLQEVISLTLLVLVIARAVNILT